ncbi:MAG: transcriptional regulator, Crp/Fnr family [Bradyrhizobium sp.]|nr:transcriptional regulator, Crp/Fnr family [Bradyrhizobium sp.]
MVPIRLGQNRILQSLPAADRAEMLPHLRQMPLVQGMVLFFHGDVIDYVCFPETGMISLLTVMKSGEQVETGIVGRTGIVGATIGNMGPLAFGQTGVQVEGTAYQLSRAKFLAMYETSAALRRLVNEFGGYLYFQAMQSAACHAVHAVHGRLCRWLLHSQDILQSELIGLTQESLAQMMGVQRAAVSLCAQQLQVAGLIQYSRGSIRIMNREGMEECACECYGATRQFTESMSQPAPETASLALGLGSGNSESPVKQLV